jgi:phosphoribosylanthranilate isomerase
MTWVKVCGLTVAADVEAAERAGADAIGFNTVPSSSRFIPLPRALELAERASVERILLTMDAEPERVLDILETTAITGVQPYGLHREETAAAAAAAGYLVLFPTSPGVDVYELPGIPLLDSPSETKLGGTGRSFDWALTERVTRDFVLAGGLGPDNVAAAVREVRPWGVDASSRLEESPGRKDHGKVAAFIERAKKT